MDKLLLWALGIAWFFFCKDVIFYVVKHLINHLVMCINVFSEGVVLVRDLCNRVGGIAIRDFKNAFFYKENDILDNKN